MDEIEERIYFRICYFGTNTGYGLSKCINCKLYEIEIQVWYICVIIYHIQVIKEFYFENFFLLILFVPGPWMKLWSLDCNGVLEKIEQELTFMEKLTQVIVYIFLNYKRICFLNKNKIFQNFPEKWYSIFIESGDYLLQFNFIKKINLFMWIRTWYIANQIETRIYIKEKNISARGNLLLAWERIIIIILLEIQRTKFHGFT